MKTGKPDSETTIGALRAQTMSWDEQNGAETFPSARLSSLAEIGLLAAFTTLDDECAVDDLITALRLVGGADLSLGRVFEGHVNAVQLVHYYGDRFQRDALLTNLAEGRSFGVWNTEPELGVTLEKVGTCYRLAGAKSFATGAGHLDRVLITARLPDGRKQLVLVDIANEALRADNRGWNVRGMRGTSSGLFDFSGMIVDDQSLVGKPGDYELEPRFSAGAWRFTAVQLGGTEALMRHWRAHLIVTDKAADPVQRVRFVMSVAAVRSAGQWVKRAAHLAEKARHEAIACVLMTRGVVEDAALQAMEGAARAVGTASFFEDSRIDRITRDLGLYLRQPVPDQARDRAAASWLETDCWGDDPWW